MPSPYASSITRIVYGPSPFSGDVNSLAINALLFGTKWGSFLNSLTGNPTHLTYSLALGHTKNELRTNRCSAICSFNITPQPTEPFHRARPLVIL